MIAAARVARTDGITKVPSLSSTAAEIVSDGDQVRHIGMLFIWVLLLRSPDSLGEQRSRYASHSWRNP